MVGIATLSEVLRLKFCFPLCFLTTCLSGAVPPGSGKEMHTHNLTSLSVLLPSYVRVLPFPAGNLWNSEADSPPLVEMQWKAVGVDGNAQECPIQPRIVSTLIQVLHFPPATRINK
jgi:hypothetical protein